MPRQMKPEVVAVQATIPAPAQAVDEPDLFVLLPRAIVLSHVGHRLGCNYGTLPVELSCDCSRYAQNRVKSPHLSQAREKITLLLRKIYMHYLPSKKFTHIQNLTTSSVSLPFIMCCFCHH